MQAELHARMQAIESLLQGLYGTTYIIQNSLHPGVETLAIETMIDLAEQLTVQARGLLKGQLTTFTSLQEYITLINNDTDEASRKGQQTKLNERLAKFDLYYDWERNTVSYTDLLQNNSKTKRIYNLFKDGGWIKEYEVNRTLGFGIDETKEALALLCERGLLQKDTLISYKGNRVETPVYHVPNSPIPVRYEGRIKEALNQNSEISAE